MNANEVLANRAAEMLGGATRRRTRWSTRTITSTWGSRPTTCSRRRRALALLLGRRVRWSTSARALADGARRESATNSRRAEDRPHAPAGRGADHARAGVRRLRRLRRHAAPTMSSARGGAAAGAESRRDCRRHRAQRRRRLHARRAIANLARVHRRCRLTPAANRFRVTQSMGDVLAYSGAMRRLAVEVGKIASDLRLLSMGPRAGHRRDRAARRAAGIVDHAGQGESVGARDGQPGVLPGDRLRRDDRRMACRGRTARTERDDAGDRVERAARVDDSARRRCGCCRRGASTGSRPTRRVPRTARPQHRARDRAQPVHRLRETAEHRQDVSTNRPDDP